MLRHSGYIVSGISDISRYVKQSNFATICLDSEPVPAQQFCSIGDELVSDVPSQMQSDMHSELPVSEPAPDVQPLDDILNKYQGQKGAVIPSCRKSRICMAIYQSHPGENIEENRNPSQPIIWCRYLLCPVPSDTTGEELDPHL